jgi:hypothetical protein
MGFSSSCFEFQERVAIRTVYLELLPSSSESLKIQYTYHCNPKMLMRRKKEPRVSSQGGFANRLNNDKT